MEQKQFWILMIVAGAVLLAGMGVIASGGDVECWSFHSQSTCTAQVSKGCIWTTSPYGGGSFCERANCFKGDITNQSYCMVTLNQTYNLSCIWNKYGANNLCDPAGGDFLGNDCNDFDGNAQGCYNSFFCQWNASSNLCQEPVGTTLNDFGSTNPGCGVITIQDLCINISGCSWGSTACSGNAGGIQCSQLNKSICGGFTMLSTCCSWNGTGCTKSIDKGCYDSMPSMPTGASFCEDYNAFKSQGLCENLSKSPWYMPCKWNNVTNECHFNSVAFGGAASFGEMGTQVGCEAIGGKWVTEQYSDSSGSLKTDTWCEFKFGFESGGGGNCNAACWSCETSVSSAQGNTTSQAQSLCENSALGYCEYRSDSNAPNGLGWCNPKQQFIEGGGKSCDSDCGACEFLKSPQAQCQNASQGCVWATDTNAPNGIGYCYGQSEKYCGNDCFSCIDFTTCAAGDGGNGACSWDQTNGYCKPAGFKGEVCFDGLDNDNDGKVDCLDSDCSTDKFCGGGNLGGGSGGGGAFANCPSFSPSGNATCTTNGCVWLKDDFESSFGGANAGHCDFPGAQCWKFDEDEGGCGAESGCSYTNFTGGICSENSTLFDSCFPQNNASNCRAVSGCGWSAEPFNPSIGHCEPLIFAQCFANQSRQSSQSLCEKNETITGTSTQICSWVTQFGSSMGHCDPVCFSKVGSNCLTTTNGLCENISGLCDPDSFGGKCFAADGNRTKCLGELNASCTWFQENSVGVFNNSVAPAWVGGWCDPKGEAGFVTFMGDIPPTILGTDINEVALSESWDIIDVGLRDDFDHFVLGVTLADKFNTSATCNGTGTYNGGPKGSGRNNYTFLFYLDSDGSSSSSCSARDDSSLGGFEFSFKYQGKWDTAFSEVKLAYQCVNSTWSPTPIPSFVSQDKMCELIGGGMIGIDKVELFKFKRLFNKSKDLRLYVTVSSVTSNDSIVNDTAGPVYYSQGAFDFKFEDCSNTGADADGDGLTSSNDPDCFQFLKFGYVPNEAGFQCGDSQDNDGDGLTDCADDSCKYDAFFCSGGLTADPNDKSAPKVSWLQVDTFPDSAFIMYDTNEPANGTLGFYNNDSNCKLLNKTILDAGLLDDNMPNYRLWHDAPMDNYEYNYNKFSTPLKNNTVFFYKMTVCDINGNCGVSACLNFTTKKTVSDCKACSSTLSPSFTPQSGAVATDPMGNITFKMVTQDGRESVLGANAASGTQFNHTDSKSFNLVIENPNDPNVTNWRITFINSSIMGKVISSVQNFSGGSDMQFNTTSNSSQNTKFVGLGTGKCQELINTFRPKKLEIGIPGNFTSEFWHCNAGLSNCTNKKANATLVGFNVTLNMTLWIVPAEWGC